MGFFTTILSKLGIGDAAAATAPDAVSAASAASTAGTAASPVNVVDVVAQLEKSAAANPQKLNWRTSIVDLLKLLDMDSSRSEEHTSELKSLMRTSYAVFCLKKKRRVN